MARSKLQFEKLVKKLENAKKELMTYSDKVAEDIEKEHSNSVQLVLSNKHLQQQVDDIYSFHQEVAWDKVTTLLEMKNPDQFFGRPG